LPGEDLHWADPDTVSLVEYLADHADGQPLLFAVTLRTEQPSPASDLARRQRGRAGMVHLPLGRLSEREVAEMIAACSPSGDPDDQSRVVRTSEGVPLGELDRAFAAHGITNVGSPIDQAEAERLLDQLALAAVPIR